MGVLLGVSLIVFLYKYLKIMMLFVYICSYYRTTLNDKSLASTPRNKHQKSFIPVSGQTCLNEHTSACSPPFPNNPQNISQMNNTN
ncbi:protein of unknown function [Enterobacter cancerogenus]|nr:protein of unknown function [Enterobacter cancerogenus]